MPTELDLRDRPGGERRDRLFDALDGAEPGDRFAVVADTDPGPDLVRYQLGRDREVAWEHDHPDAEPRRLRVSVGGELAGDLPAFDVRDLEPQRRHEALLTLFDELAADEGFVLVNDHDPKPLYHELRSTHGDVIDWTYAAEDEGEWRVEVRKTADPDTPDSDVVARYDVREIPKPERHPTIHHRYGMIPDGGTMELVAPHEPRPLHGEFRERYGDGFEWEVVESESGRCRVHVTKRGATDRDDEDDGDTDDGDTDDAIEPVEELDVRELPPARRHERIFDAYAELAAGEGFVLVNDHDPKPLYHQFEAEAGPEFRWTYRRRDPGEFRVLIGKAADGGEGAANADGPASAPPDSSPEAPF